MGADCLRAFLRPTAAEDGQAGNGREGLEGEARALAGGELLVRGLLALVEIRDGLRAAGSG